MMSDTEIRAVFVRVLDRMVEAGWLHHYTETDGKGFHLGWTGPGGRHAQCLKDVVEVFRLNDDGDSLVLLDKLAHGQALPAEYRGTLRDLPPPYLLEFVKDRIVDLGIHGDSDGLLAMVHVVVGWCPGADTKVIFHQ